MEASGTSKISWYLRRSGQQAGPFSSAAVRRLLLQDQVTLDDEVSRDRSSWKPVRDVAEVVPPQLRGGGFSELANVQAAATPWRSILVFVLVISAIVGFGFWWGGSGMSDGSDCSAPPQAGVDWSNCRLQGLQAAGVDLKAAWMQNADLFNAAFTGADLSGAKLDYANLGRADLAYATMRGTSLRGVDLRNADLTNADLSGADLSYADLSGAVLAGATLDSTRFDKALWLDGRPCREGSVDGCIPAAQAKDSVR